MKIVTNVILILTLVVISNTVFSQWEIINVPTTSTTSIRAFTSIGADLYVAAGGNIYKSTNNGSNFTRIDSTTMTVNSLASNGNRLFKGTEGGISYSDNFGNNWTLSSGVGNNSVTEILITPNNIVYIIAGLVMGRSTDNGATFTMLNTVGIPSHMTCLAVNGTNVYAGGGIYNHNLYLTTNQGSVWINQNITGWDSTGITDIKTNGSNIYFTSLNGIPSSGIPGGLWISSNSGTGWRKEPVYQNIGSSKNFYSILLQTNNILVGSDSGIFLSKDGGSTWRNKNEGVSIPYDSHPKFKELLSNNGWIFSIVETPSRPRLYRRQYSEIISVRTISTEVPANFSLHQNYPNPFNPTTNIRYQIPKESVVTIKIFDITGKEIETLVNEKVSPGTYETNWNASRYSSGMYFYKLESEYFSEVKKMILVK